MQDLISWFDLKCVSGIGCLLFKRLIDAFQSPQRVFQASRKELLAVEGMNDRVVQAIHRHRTPAGVQRELDLIKTNDIDILTLTDPRYPPLLREIPDPPPFLYVQGKLPHYSPSIAVVGSRMATAYGLAMTRSLCADLALRDMIVVSGMAIGIDTAAHEGALSSAGQTVAVLGSGLAQIYPPQNKKLFQRIAENGAVISEFAMQTEPERHNFPIRNRIISGMSLGTVVVEATRRSGSLITARLAVEQNREVFAVPGSIQSFKSIGTHSLIKQGAKLVENAQDIFDEFPLLSTPARPQAPQSKSSTPESIPDLAPDEKRTLDVLSTYPEHIDGLLRKTKLESGKLLSILLQLELKGLVRQDPGKFFSRTDLTIRHS